MREKEMLFHKYDFAANIRAAPERLREAVGRLTDSELSAQDMEPLVERLVREHMFEVPAIAPEKVTVDEREIELDVSGDGRRVIFDRGRPFYIKATEYRFFVPFTGQRDIFFCRPSTYDLSPPYAEFEGDELVVGVIKSSEKMDAAAVRREFEQSVDKIQKYLTYLRSDVSGLEESLRQTARTTIQQRREKRQRDASVVDQIGFPRRG